MSHATQTKPDRHSAVPSYIDAIVQDGYCYIPGAFSQEQVAQALEKIRFWYERTVSDQSDRMPYLNKNQPMVYNLQTKDIFFLRMVLGSPIIEAILKHFLNDKWFTALPADAPNYILRSFLARSSNHQMPMHIDSFIPSCGRYVFIMQCAILLQDSTLENGCTVLVPKSHLSDEYTTQDSFDIATPAEGKAGDLIFWDSRTWHGARANESGGTRWAVIATFCRWWIKQAFDIPGNVPQEIYDQLTNSEKAVLGYCSVPYDNETIGIDMKRAYELLPRLARDYRK